MAEKIVEMCRIAPNGKKEILMQMDTESGKCRIDIDPEIENLRCRKIDFTIFALEEIVKELKKYDSKMCIEETGQDVTENLRRRFTYG